MHRATLSARTRYPRQVYEQHRRGGGCAHHAENGEDDAVDGTDGANKGHFGEAAARTGTTSADWYNACLPRGDLGSHRTDCYNPGKAPLIPSLDGIRFIPRRSVY